MYSRKRGPAPLVLVKKRTKAAAAATYTAKTQRPLYVRSASKATSEVKFFDTALSFNVDATGEVPATGQLVLIPQGTTESTRIGKKVNLTSILIQAGISYSPGASATAPALVYMWLVQDKQCNGAAASATDVLTGSGFAAAVHNLSNSDRFRTLKKWVIEFNPGAGVTTAWADMRQNLTWYGKCDIPIDFGPGAGGAITDQKSNNVFLLAGCNGADDLVTVTGTARVRYTD